MLDSIGLISLIILQSAWTPSVGTPGVNKSKSEIIHSTIIKEAEKNNIKPITLSSELKKPTVISNESVESFDLVKTRFQQSIDFAIQESISSYLSDISGELLPIGCILLGIHPSGVERESDNKLNGNSTLIECQSAIYEIRVFDYSQKLTQEIFTKLPDNFYQISGGYASIGYGKSLDGRSRLDMTCIGNRTTIDIVAQSKNIVNREEFVESTTNLIRKFMLVYDKKP